MTFDERLDRFAEQQAAHTRAWNEKMDRLTERQEALTQSVELMAHLHDEWDKKN